MALSWGRECKLGWGYNEPFGRLIPVQGELPNVTSWNVNEWEYNAYSSSLILCSLLVSLFLERSYKKSLDFQIVFDDNEYWLIQSLFWRRAETSGKLPEYPPNCSHFVHGIAYGVDLWVLFPKIGFPEDDDNEVKKFFEYRYFNETQKKTKCKVLINYNEIREITLQELLNFMKELEEEKHSQYDIPVLFDCMRLTQKVRENAISNQREFRYFLIYLYRVYRKIEIKMKEAGYPDVLPDLDSNEVSLKNIRVNLNKAKEDYKSIDKNDFLKMYPILKKLFFSYTDYIRYCMDNSVDMDEGDRLPETIEEIKPWLQQLNTWVPDTTKAKGINWVLIIGVPIIIIIGVLITIKFMKCRTEATGNQLELENMGGAEELEETQTPAFNPDDLLRSIYRQLQQIQIRTEGTTDQRILIAIISLTNNRIQQIEAALRDLQDVDLDGNIRHMIDLYLNRNR